MTLKVQLTVYSKQVYGKLFGGINIVEPSATEEIEVIIKLPRAIYDFYQAILILEKQNLNNLPKYLGLEIIKSLEGHFDSDLEYLIDLENIIKNYNLDKIANFNPSIKHTETSKT